MSRKPETQLYLKQLSADDYQVVKVLNSTQWMIKQKLTAAEVNVILQRGIKVTVS